jgi:hypothetical protein
MKVAILYSGFSNANSVRPVEIKRFLDKRDCETTLVDLEKMLFSKQLRIQDPFRFVLGKVGLGDRKALVKQMQKWADVIERDIIDKGHYDLVICESFLHAYVFTRDLGCQTLFDCPTPYVDELEASNEYDRDQIGMLRDIEREIYEGSTYVAFHWRTYKDFVSKYVYDGNNLITLDWGCHPKENRAMFDARPKVVYIGYLGGYWINKELLSKLSNRAPSMIDVYGLPRPEKRYGLNYLGYAEDTDVLNRYQFGLITISKDRLRREGFSAKHLEYLSYGLPVLVPDWRENLELIKGSVPYNEVDFLDMVELYSDEEQWNRMSDTAYEQAKGLDWDITLKGLEDIVGK